MRRSSTLSLLDGRCVVHNLTKQRIKTGRVDSVVEFSEYLKCSTGTQWVNNRLLLGTVTNLNLQQREDIEGL